MITRRYWKLHIKTKTAFVFAFKWKTLEIENVGLYALALLNPKHRKSPGAKCILLANNSGKHFPYHISDIWIEQHLVLPTYYGIKYSFVGVAQRIYIWYAVEPSSSVWPAAWLGCKHDVNMKFIIFDVIRRYICSIWTYGVYGESGDTRNVRSRRRQYI